jgi:hypothetical protein
MKLMVLALTRSYTMVLPRMTVSCRQNAAQQAVPETRIVGKSDAGPKLFLSGL